MSAPPFLLGAALLFWAQQTGLWLAAVPMAAVIEGSRLMSRRWEFSREDFNRVGDLCTVLFAALVVYLYLTREMLRALTAVLAWIPLSTFPLIAAQNLSSQGRLGLGALFWSLRRGASGLVLQSIDISYPYFTLCILSAGAANVRTPVFYAGMFVLCAWGLWRFRPVARPAWAWATLVLAAGVLGYAGQAGLMTLQVSLEKAAMNAVFGGGEVPMDPYQTRTAIGSIGAIQQSGDIALRVRAEGKPPGLLRTASYNHYANAQWFAREPGFRPAAPGTQAASWVLSASAPSRSVVVTASWPKGEGLLALPLDAARVDGLPAGALALNRLGAVKASDAPGALAYRVELSPGAVRDAPPDAFDLEVPKQEAAALRSLAAELKLDGSKTGPSVAAVERFFAENFRYTIYQREKSPEPLGDFLLKSRAGHCEYFATATVLLLRSAGIPARYAGGYSVQEYSRLEKAFVVRQRHAHAWTLAWVDGAWRDVDTTPLSWPEIEQGRASRLEPLSDMVSMLRLRVSLWRWRAAASTGRGRGPLAWLLLLALAGWFFWKASALFKASRSAPGEFAALPAPSGVDSEFYLIEERLEKSGLGRRPWEAPAAWVERIASDLGASRTEPLRLLLSLHYRYRFDPEGISGEERKALRTGSRDWLSAAGGLECRKS
ncbi:MAG: transglutaminase domain-containing protein [Elusimicrobia bacterium]|nr:transglutaminase domain-containing protein [Elusimicrobiota bacterium]